MSDMPHGYVYQDSLPCCLHCDHCQADDLLYCEKHDVYVDELGKCPDFS